MRCKIRRCNRRAVRNGYCNLHYPTSRGRATPATIHVGPSSQGYTTFGDLAKQAVTSYAQKKGSQMMGNAGLAMIGHSYTYIHNEQKAWTNLSKKETRRFGIKVDKDTLYRPTKWSDQISMPRRGDGRWLSNRQIHWERRPYRGTYTMGQGYERPNIARPHPYKTGQVRIRMRMAGWTLYGTSKALPVIGYATLGYGFYKQSDDPESYLGYLLSLTPTYGMLPQQHQAVVQSQSKRASNWYLQKWFRGSTSGESQ